MLLTSGLSHGQAYSSALVDGSGQTFGGTNRTHFKLNSCCAIPQGHFVPEVTCLSLFPGLPEPSAQCPLHGKQSTLRVPVTSSLSACSQGILFFVCSVLPTFAVSAFPLLCVSFSLASVSRGRAEIDRGGSLLSFRAV